MSRRPATVLLIWISIVFVSAVDSQAQGILWSGPMISFTNLAGSDWTQAANQDRLTDDVWLTRSTTRGIFNAAPGLESSYTKFLSPSGTEWAYGVLANYATLTYTDWQTWNGGQFNVPSMVGQSAVVHLINSDIYLALTFTSWGGNGGGFSYERSTPLAVPEPGAVELFISVAVLVVAFRAPRKNKSVKPCSGS